MNNNKVEIARLRQQHHLEFKKHFESGDFTKAEAGLLKALNMFGPHVGLLADICAVYYQSGQFSSFSHFVRVLNFEFEKCSELIQKETFLRTSLCLGKYFEEQIQIFEALKFYKLGETVVPSFSVESDLIIKHKAQRLRLLSQIGKPKSEISNLYLECSQVSTENSDLKIELEHALLLAETEVHSIETAMIRFDYLRIRNLPIWEIKLIIFDFIEVCLRRREVNTKTIQILVGWVLQLDLHNQMDDFEKSLFFLATMDLRSATNTLLSTRISPFCRLRILLLIQQKGKHKEIKGLYSLLTDGLSRESKKLTDEWMSQYFTDQTVTLIFPQDVVLQIDNQEMKIKKNSFAFKLMSLIRTQAEVSIEQTIKAIYGEEFSESAFLKLRVSLSRFNRDFSDHFGITKCVEIRDGMLALAGGLRLQTSS